jgi:hypothetical protein
MKTLIERRKPLRAFFELGRVLRSADTASAPYRVVEGYAYANAWVGDGVNLKRSAMVAATDDYMRWGAVREMHQPSAVGTAIGQVEVVREDGEAETLPLGCFWDERGVLLRSKIVDPDAILKIDEGVYRGYSVGIRATLMRGSDIEACSWIENSLVDRPADPDGGFTAVRVDAAAQEYEVTRMVEGRTFADYLDELRQQDVINDLSSAYYTFLDCCYSILQAGGDAGMLSQNLDEFVAYVKSHVFAEAGMERVQRALEAATAARQALADLPSAVERAASAQASDSESRTALETARAEATRLRSDLAARDAQIERLTRTPDPNQQRPMRTPAGFVAPERQFAASGDPDALKDLRAELARLDATDVSGMSEPDRQTLVTRMMTLKSQIAAGEAA